MVGIKNEKYLAVQTVLELKKTSAWIEDVLQSHFAKYNLTYPKFRVLMQLKLGTEEGLTLSELSKAVGVSNANITGLVDRLARDNWVYREPHPKDRRVYNVKLTENAVSLLTTFLPLHNEYVFESMSGLNLEEKQELIRLLGKLKK